MDDINQNKFERLMAATLPENDPSTHLDVVQNFRLYLQDMSREKRIEVLEKLKLPDGRMTLLDELKEWKYMLDHDFYMHL